MTEQYPVGIDFGTSTCKMVCHHDGETIKVRLDRKTGSVLMPSVVAFDKENDRIIVGSEAEGRTLSLVASTYPSTFPGHKCVKLGLDNPEFASLEFGGKTYDAFKMSVLIFEEMLEAANEHLGYMPDAAVLTHPAYFSHAQVTLIHEAAKAAGLFVSHLRAEPVAAALAWAVSERIEGAMAVYDFGGGTFDTTVLSVGKSEIQTYAKRGNPELGGRKLTETVYEALFVPAAREAGDWDLNLQTRDLHDVVGQRARTKLWDAAEEAKVQLSSTDRYEKEVLLPLDAEETKHVPVQITFTRKDLEETVLGLVRGATESVREAVHDAGLTVKDIAHVLPVGGVTRMPMIREQLIELFGESRVHQPADPDTLVAQGAALTADVATVARVTINDVLAQSLRRRLPKSTKTKELIGRGAALGQNAKVELNFAWPGGNVSAVSFDLCEGEYEEFSLNKPVGTVFLRPEQPLPPKTPIALTIWYDENIGAFTGHTNLAAVKVALEPIREANLAALAPDITAVKMADVFIGLDVSRSFRNSLLPLATRECLSLEDQLRRSNVDCRFSVIAFADPAVPGEEIVARSCAVEGSLRGWLTNLPQYDGGDTHEDVPALLLRLVMELAVSRGEAQKLVLLFTDAPTKAPEALPGLLPRVQATGAPVFVFAPMSLPAPSLKFYEDLAFATGGQYVDIHNSLYEGVQKALGLMGIAPTTGAAPA
ncbi:MAG: Hsp70 family protein [Armatimonadetes bacterium]|nr:Hsp70 family protein [Armatimonadota bacterium]